MTDIAHTERIKWSSRAQHTRRYGKLRKDPMPNRVQMTITLPDQHYLDAIREEAKIRGMSVNHFIRSMLRGYFGVA